MLLSFPKILNKMCRPFLELHVFSRTWAKYRQFDLLVYLYWWLELLFPFKTQEFPLNSNKSFQKKSFKKIVKFQGNETIQFHQATQCSIEVMTPSTVIKVLIVRKKCLSRSLDFWYRKIMLGYYIWHDSWIQISSKYIVGYHCCFWFWYLAVFLGDGLNFWIFQRW